MEAAIPTAIGVAGLAVLSLSGLPTEVFSPYVTAMARETAAPLPAPVEPEEPMWEDFSDFEWMSEPSDGGFVGDLPVDDGSGSFDWLSDIYGTASRVPGVNLPMLGGMGVIPAIAGGAGRTLASLFGAGRGWTSRFNINGITGTTSQLWKYVRRFGAGPVATALGITVGALGGILLSAPERPKRRRRGISGRDIRTTKRVVNFVSRMAAQIGCVRAPAHFRRKAGAHSH